MQCSFHTVFLLTYLPFIVNNNNYNNSSYYKREQQNFLSIDIQSSSTTFTNSSTSIITSKTPTRSALDAITIAINNYMEPTIRTMNERKREIDRSYSESITSVEEYAKIYNKEKVEKPNYQKKI